MMMSDKCRVVIKATFFMPFSDWLIIENLHYTKIG